MLVISEFRPKINDKRFLGEKIPNIEMTRFRWKKVIPIRFYNKPLLITDFGGYFFFTDTEFWVLILLITNF